MKCPECDLEMKELFISGILVDYCSTCRGTWYDKNELTFQALNPRKLARYLNRALIDQKKSNRSCPKCGVPMFEGGLTKKELRIDLCSKCRGVWLDRDEFEVLNQELLKTDIKHGKQVDCLKSGSSITVNTEAITKPSISLVSLPNLALRSFSVMLVLYGMLFLVLISAAHFLNIPVHIAFWSTAFLVLLNYFFSPYVYDLSLKWFNSMKFVLPEALPEHLRTFIGNIVKSENIPFPKFGIIEDGTPNAFTYGHSPKDARIIITRGLLTILEPDEIEAVVAHEMGHALHWDILLMTMASMVPMILYYIFRICLAERRHKRRSGKNDPTPIIGIISYLLYIISQYVLLYFSRAREYFADRFSGRVKNPNKLVSALIKIAYGLASRPANSHEKNSRLEALNALGVFDFSKARSLISSSLMCADSKEGAVYAMQWDLWNPWGGYYELHSTHPLPAKRIMALSRQASSQGTAPFIIFDEKKPESYWDEFFIDILIIILPLICGVLSIVYGISVSASGFRLLFISLFGVCLGMFIKTLLSYPGGYFADFKVKSLLRKIKVSSVRAVPVKIKGRIIGRGIPGLVFSEDMVLQDDTGYIFLDYRQPLQILNFLFGLFRVKNIIGKEVEIEGWYRRSPMPYIEMKRLVCDHASHTCYVYTAKIIFSLFLSGFFLILYLMEFSL